MLQPPPVRQRGACCPVDTAFEAGPAGEVVEVLKALADPTRLRIAAALLRAGGPICICDFTAVFELGQPTVSHHMAKLRGAGLVESSKVGIWAHYRLRDDITPAARRILEAAVEGA